MTPAFVDESSKPRFLAMVMNSSGAFPVLSSMLSKYAWKDMGVSVRSAAGRAGPAGLHRHVERPATFSTSGMGDFFGRFPGCRRAVSADQCAAAAIGDSGSVLLPHR